MAPVLKRALRIAVFAAAAAAPLAAQEFEAAGTSARSAVPAAVPAFIAGATWSGSPALTAPPALTGAAALLCAPAAPEGSPAAASAAAAAPRVPAAGWDSARIVAHRLGAARGVPEAGHSIFYDNLARYVYNSADDAALDALASRPGRLRPLDVSSVRWSGKLQRDLAEPYDDAQALARLDHLQAQFEELVLWLKTASPRGGYSILVMGGLTRGRVSALSDLDVMLETNDADLLNAALASPFGYQVKGRDVALGPVPRNPRLRESLGAAIDVGTGESALGDSFVRSLFFRARAAVAAAPMRRDAPLDEAQMAAIKRLGRILDETRDAAQRARLEERIDVLAAALPAFPAPAAPGRYVPIGDVRVDLRAPGATALLRTVGTTYGRPVIGVYSHSTRRILSAATLGHQGVTGHESIRPVGFDRRDLLGWTAALSPDGNLRFAGSGSLPGTITPGLRRKIRRYLGIGAAGGSWRERLSRLTRAVLGALGAAGR